MTLILSIAGAQVMTFRLRYDGWIEEVLNAAGSIAPGPNSWTLIGRDLSLEFGAQAAATLGWTRDLRMYLDVDDNAIRWVRAGLLEILQSACFLVDTPEGRITG